MDDVLSRFVTDLIGRITGPLSFRLILQPMMAIFFAVRDGLRDKADNRAPYFTSLFSVGEAQRHELFREAWKAIAKVFVLAFVLDVVYQLIVLRWVYPFESLVVAMILAILPYVLLRGVVDRLARIWLRPSRHAR